MKKIIGIDPGLNGAIVLLSDAESSVHDMPTFEITVNEKKKRKVDTARLSEIIKATGASHAFIENVHAMPEQGVTSAFSFGFICGLIEACVAAAGIPYTYVAPQTWKAAKACPRDKDGARMRASQLLPAMAHHWPLVKHDGRAEAALIALYGWERAA